LPLTVKTTGRPFSFIRATNAADLRLKSLNEWMSWDKSIMFPRRSQFLRPRQEVGKSATRLLMILSGSGKGVGSQFKRKKKTPDPFNDPF